LPDQVGEKSSCSEGKQVKPQRGKRSVQKVTTDDHRQVGRSVYQRFWAVIKR